MATSFSANQYQNAFYSKKLQNWELPSVYRLQPRTLSGTTTFIANERGHLMDGVPRSRRNPWGSFVGTWDLPRRIPGHSAHVPTARSTYAQELLAAEQQNAKWVIKGGKKNATRRNLDPAYASKNPPVEPGAENAPEKTFSPGPIDRPLSLDHRSGANAPATSMFPAIPQSNAANDYVCTCGSGHDKPASPMTNRIPTPGFGTEPQVMGGRTPTPPAKSPLASRHGSGLIAL